MKPDLWCECVCADQRQEESQWTRQALAAVDGCEDEPVRSDPISADIGLSHSECLGGVAASISFGLGSATLSQVRVADGPGSYPASTSVCISSQRNTASGGLHSAFSPELDDPTRSQLRLSMTRRLQTDQSFEVTQDLLRGLSLRSTLQGLGWMWRLSPKDISPSAWQRLQRKSKPVQSLDIFISHTWKTGGIPKMLALFLSSGWRFALLAWLVAQVLTTMIYLACPECIITPITFKSRVLDFEAYCPLEPWMIVAGMVGTVSGFLSAPYFPFQKFGASNSGDMCFVDIACIHQQDSVLKQRGIYGIGGFLKCARELRVLWTPPYLSRMWCIFELAAYRKANPSGRITLAPIFIEHSVHLVAVSLWGCVICYWGALALDLTEDYGYFIGLVLPLGIALLPVACIVHGLRYFFCAKHRLFQDLRRFKLESAECSEEFDAVFVHTAIQSWYGSTAAFEHFVQETLVQEIPEVTISPGYCLLLATIPVTMALEECMAVARGGAPTDVVLSSLIGHVYGLTLCWVMVCLQLLYRLCDRFAVPFEPGFCNFMRTLAVYIMVAFCFLVGAVVGEVAYRYSLLASAMFATCTTLMCGFAYGWIALCDGKCTFDSCLRAQHLPQTRAETVPHQIPPMM
ncbi:hypothetical protein AK812_SmicGene34695 [Symbiodinium microadriaticum]|uniref:Uncharacterized protein n=1 Tax=Symbiodinium microadriaticum TaxID=2951 RepID=A0A1Q9CNB7_SYMMI|nr:hypothetical protein AK812_SmicGene34695 [Symbiodinium microadriaticum]CAE7172090.1 unnamed protein product [Symbiodinium microadriaticum]